MDCKDAELLTSHHRDLTPDDRQRLDEHVRGCQGCAAALERARLQDRLLAGVAVLPVPDRLRAAVRQRTTAADRAPAARPAWGRLAAAALLLCLVVSVGGVGASARALPGDALYAVKRTAEQIGLRLAPGVAARVDLEARLEARRRAEALDLLRLGRVAAVTISGSLEEARGGVWVVGGLPVVVEDAWPGDAPAVGARVRVRAETREGALHATHVEAEAPPAANDAGPGAEGEEAGPAAGRPTSEGPEEPDRRGGAGQGPATPERSGDRPAGQAGPDAEGSTEVRPTPPASTETAPPTATQTPSPPATAGPGHGGGATVAPDRTEPPAAQTREEQPPGAGAPGEERPGAGVPADAGAPGPGATPHRDGEGSTGARGEATPRHTAEPDGVRGQVAGPRWPGG